MDYINTTAKIAILVCACGKSSRFPSNKLTYQLPTGKTILQTTLDNIIKGIGNSKVSASCTVIIPADRPKMLRIVEQAGCSVCILQPASNGLGETIAYGVQQTQNAKGWIICLADMPGIGAQIYQTIIDSAAIKILVPEYNGRRGHPVFFPQRFYKQLVSLEGDKGAASIIKRHEDLLELLPVNTLSVLLDIDTADDLSDLSQQ